MMQLLREVVEGKPKPPPYGWNIGHLANHGVILTAHGFSLRLDGANLDKFFDLVEAGEEGEVRDHDGDVVNVRVRDDDVVLSRAEDPTYPHGILLDLDLLAELGIEQYEEAEDEAESSSTEPELEIDELTDGDTIKEEFDILDEGVKRAFRRVGKKIKRGFRVTSGFRKGRVVSSAAGAFKPRAKASTRMKLKIAARKKKFVRILKGKMTRRKPTSKRLTAMNKRLP